MGKSMRAVCDQPGRQASPWRGCRFTEAVNSSGRPKTANAARAFPSDQPPRYDPRSPQHDLPGIAGAPRPPADTARPRRSAAPKPPRRRPRHPVAATTSAPTAGPEHLGDGFLTSAVPRRTVVASPSDHPGDQTPPDPFGRQARHGPPVHAHAPTARSTNQPRAPAPRPATPTVRPSPLRLPPQARREPYPLISDLAPPPDLPLPRRQGPNQTTRLASTGVPGRSAHRLSHFARDG